MLGIIRAIIAVAVAVSLQMGMTDATEVSPQDAAEECMHGIATMQEETMDRYAGNSYVNFLVNLKGDEETVQRMQEAIFRNFTWQIEDVEERDDAAVAKVKITQCDFSDVLGKYDKKSYKYITDHLYDEDTIRRELLSARTEGGADACVVLVHWGTEYSAEPDEDMHRWAELFLECGVDVTVGSHPHVLQPLEVITDEAGRQMPVFWSLGNLISRQDQPEQVLGGLAEFSVQYSPEGCRIADCRLVPVITHQTKDTTTAYLLSDYTEKLAEAHRLDLGDLLQKARASLP